MTRITTPHAKPPYLTQPLAPAHDLATLDGPERFARAIERARRIMLGAPWFLRNENRPLERAAAERQLKHNISAALDQGFILHDPLFPEFRLSDRHNQFGLFNPDNRYHLASISAPGRYVVRGRRGTSADLQIQVGSGVFKLETVSQMSSEELVTDDEGNFEIVISDTCEGDNWLAIADGERGATTVLIRESFMDWERETAGTWTIERTDTWGTPRPLVTPDLVSGQYARAAQHLTTSTAGWVAFVGKLLGELEPNTLSEPAESASGGLTGQFNVKGVFPAHADTATVISVPRSRARYQSIQVGDLWFNSLDYTRRQTSLTAALARPSSDGLLHMVVSRRDPGVANWLDPAGASTVFAFLRWQGLPGRRFRKAHRPTVRVVPFDELRAHLPHDEPHVGPEARAEQLAARQAAALRSPRGF